jgi:hypothetical protein
MSLYFIITMDQFFLLIIKKITYIIMLVFNVNKIFNIN